MSAHGSSHDRSTMAILTNAALSTLSLVHKAVYLLFGLAAAVVLEVDQVICRLSEKAVLAFREPPVEILGTNRLDFVERRRWRETY